MWGNDLLGFISTLIISTFNVLTKIVVLKWLAYEINCLYLYIQSPLSYFSSIEMAYIWKFQFPLKLTSAAFIRKYISQFWMFCCKSMHCLSCNWFLTKHCWPQGLYMYKYYWAFERDKKNDIYFHSNIRMEKNQRYFDK